MKELRQWLNDEFMDPHGLRPHFPIEVRWSAADDIWLSPSSGQRTCWIGIIQYKCVACNLVHSDRVLNSANYSRPYAMNAPYRKLFSRFEAILLRHQGRPHWAKSHDLRPEQLRQLYPKFDDFVALLRRVDPEGLFRNEYVQRHIFGKAVDSRLFKIRQGSA